MLLSISLQRLQGRYSAILAGAAFMDSAALFSAYWSPALAPARALVDEVRWVLRQLCGVLVLVCVM